jgi:hypothetical protein
MYITYREAWEKKFSHAEICSFVEAHPLPVYDLTTLMYTSQAPSPANGIIS